MQNAQKLQWMQLASSNDPFSLDGSMYCSICSEPLIMEAVITTPCKHHFHGVCIRRLELPQCPLCCAELPFSWFLPGDHPLVEKGYRVVMSHQYKPIFPGGPSKGSGGFTLHRPPPKHLLGSGCSAMRSYMHRIPPLGPDEDDEDDLGSPRQSSASASEPQSPDLRRQASDGSTTSESSSEDSNSAVGDNENEFDLQPSRNQRSKDSKNGTVKWTYSALGRMRLCTNADGSRVKSKKLLPSLQQAKGGINSSAGGSDGGQASGLKRLLLIDEHIEESPSLLVHAV